MTAYGERKWERQTLKQRFVEMNEQPPDTDAILKCTCAIVAAYISHNPIPIRDLSAFIKSVHGVLNSLPLFENVKVPTDLMPAVPVHKSITPAYLICLEDGRKLKMLKRHLRASYDMSPASYRAKWNLPPDYPMVAPNYAAWRSEFAKKIGLGRSHSTTTEQKQA